jgi:N-acetylglucosamine kinase-like BadF-type ATPase
MDCVLGIDGGGSKTVCLLMNSDRLIMGRGEAGACNYQSVGIEFAKKSLESAIYQALQECRKNLNSNLNISGICLGLAGVGRPKDVEIIQFIVTELQQNSPADVNWGLLPSNTIICHDALIALVGGIGNDVGIVVSAGTGSIVYGRNQEGKTKRVGGWGYILGDEGGGYRIAIAGMQAGLKAYDGRGEATSLVEIFQENLQLTNIEELVEVVYRSGKGVREIAAMALLVHKAAKNGDMVANNIIDEAVGELVKATTVVINELFENELFEIESSLEVVTTGSLWKGESNIRLRFEECLLKRFPSVKVIYPRYEPAFGAGLLALKNSSKGKRQEKKGTTIKDSSS